MRNILSLAMFFVLTLSYGQSEHFSEKERTYIELAEYYTNDVINVDSAIFYAKKAKVLSSSNDNLKNLALSYHLLIENYQKSARLDSAKFFYHKAYQSYQKLNDSSKLLELNILAGVFLFYNNGEKIVRIHELLPKVRETKDSVLLGKVLVNLCVYYILNDNISNTSIQFAQEALSIMNSLQDTKGVCRVYNIMANMYLSKGNKKRGLYYLDKAIEYTQEYEESEIVDVYINGANKLRNLPSTYSIAKDFYLAAEKKAVEQGVQKYYQGAINEGLANIAITYEKKYEEGFSYMKENIAMDTENKDYYGHFFNCGTLGSFYKQVYIDFYKKGVYKINLLDSSELYLKKALHINQEHLENNVNQKIMILDHLGRLFWLKEKFQESVDTVFEIIDLASSLEKNRQVLKTAYSWLAKNYAELKLYKNAYKYNLLKDSLERLDTEDLIDSKTLEAISKFRVRIIQDSLKISRDSTKIIQTNEKLLQKEKENYKLYIGVVTIILLLFLIFMIVFYNQKRKVEVFNQELSVLNRRVNLLNRELKHRVKNNLNQLQGIINVEGIELKRRKDAQPDVILYKISSYIQALASLYSLLESENELYVNAKDFFSKLEATHSILGGGKTKISINDVPNVSYKSEAITHIAYIFIELINNALKHAFDKVENPYVNIKFVQEEKYTIIWVKDNGRGMTKEKMKASFGTNLVIELIELKMEGIIDLEKSLVGTLYSITIPNYSIL